MNSRYSFKLKTADFISYFILTIVALVCVIPFYIMLINATHFNGDIISKVILLPGSMLKSNYGKLLNIINPLRMLFNSLVISVPSVLLAAYVGSLTAFGFAKYKFKGNNILFWAVLATMMIPTQMTLIGLSQISKGIGLLGSYWPIILPNIASASTVFWLKGHFEGSVHDSLLEAARVEGFSEIQIFHRIGLPLAKTGIATISIFNFVNAWNNYLTPLALLSDSKKFPISIGIAIIRQIEPRDLGAVYMGLVISVIPILIVFAFCSKYILAGLSSGSVKG